MAVASPFDVSEIVDLAFEDAEFEPEALNGGQVRSAMRRLQSVLVDLSNRLDGLAWQVEPAATVPISPGDGVIPLPAGTIDVLSMTYRAVGDCGAPLTRTGHADLALLAGRQGRPDRYAVDRSGQGQVAALLWPSPDMAGEIVYARLRWPDAVTAMTETVGVPYEWAMALRKLLAVELYNLLPPGRKTPQLYNRLMMEAEASVTRARIAGLNTGIPYKPGATSSALRWVRR